MVSIGLIVGIGILAAGAIAFGLGGRLPAARAELSVIGSDIRGLGARFGKKENADEKDADQKTGAE